MHKDVIDAHLADIRHIALDMDGTIYRGGTLFDFTQPFLANMKELGIGYTFLTNNSSRSTSDYVAHLKELGLPANADQFYTSGTATIEYLRSECPEYRRLFVLGTESLRDEFRREGFTVDSATSEDRPDAVVVGFDSDLAYRRLCRAGYWIEQGIPFIATHPDVVCPTDQATLLVDCGAICACLEAATGRRPDIVLGKPHPVMMDGILSRFQLEPSQLAMVGDRLTTDIAMAKAVGAFGVLVCTGEATKEDAELASVQPDLVVADLEELGQLLCREKGRTA